MPTFNLTVNYAGNLRPLTPDARREWNQDAVDVYRKIFGGASMPGASITASDGGTVATGTVTFTGNGTATDTVTVAGQVFTAVASGATNNQWNVGTSTTTAAANLAAAINASTTVAFRGAVFATASGAVVTISAAAAGPLGNLVTLSKTSTSISAVAANLAGGASNTAYNLLY